MAKQKWKVVVKATIRHQLEVVVVAKDWSEARELSFIEARNKLKLPKTASIDGDCIQLGEPWVYSQGWYDLHGPSNVIVAKRATGNRFTREDIDLLSTRLNKIGFTVVDKWNGVGCPEGSFRCSGREGAKQFTKKQLKEFLSPRPDAITKW